MGCSQATPVQYPHGWQSLVPKPSSNVQHNAMTYIFFADPFIYLVPSQNYNMIYKCNVRKGSSYTWNAIKLKYKCVPEELQSAAYNEETNTLYLYNRNQLYQINLFNSHYVIFENVIDVGIGTKCMIINNELYLIGGSCYFSNFIWDKKQKQFLWTDIKDKKLQYGICDHEVIQIKSKQQMFLFGAKELKLKKLASKRTNNIYYANIVQYKCVWKPLDIIMPKKASKYIAVLCKNDTKIIILSGIENSEWNSKIINVFDTIHHTFTQSYVQYPGDYSDHSKCVIVSDLCRIPLLIDGIARLKCNIDAIPRDIVYLIQSICPVTEELHIVEGGIKGNHWKINVDKILFERFNEVYIHSSSS
eukprot:335877_1